MTHCTVAAIMARTDCDLRAEVMAELQRAILM